MFSKFNPKQYFRTFLLVAVVFTATHSMAQSKPTTTGYAPINGTKAYYEVYGAGNPLVLLHGAFMTIDANWAQLIPELSKTHKVIAIEMRGHGHSPLSPNKLSLQTFASDVEGVMDYLKIDSADVVGYSMGGSIAYNLVIKSPKRVKKLVIISSTYKSAGWIPTIAAAFKMMKPEYLANSPMQAGYDAVAPDKSNWGKFTQQMIDFIQEPFDLGDANIAKITSPVLIIAGDNDGLDKVELAKTYNMLGGGVSADMAPMPKSRLAIVPGQSHVNVMMQTATIQAYLTEFLK